MGIVPLCSLEGNLLRAQFPEARFWIATGLPTTRQKTRPWYPQGRVFQTQSFVFEGRSLVTALGLCLSPCLFAKNARPWPTAARIYLLAAVFL